MDTHGEHTPDERSETEGERIRAAGLAGGRPDRDDESESARIRAAGLPGERADAAAEAEAATTDAHKIRADDLPGDETGDDVDLTTDAEKIRPDGVD
ncbi:hypothetical protein [Cellulomonas sp. URHB0016]